MCVTNGRHLGVNRLLIGGICEPFRWGVDDVGLSDLGMASFIRSASPSAVVLTITLSLGRSMTRRSRIAARGPARSSYRPAEGCRSVRLRVRPPRWPGSAPLAPPEPLRTGGPSLDNPLPNASGRGPHPVPVRQCLFRTACNMRLEAQSRSAETALIGAVDRRTGSKVKNRKHPAMERVKDAFS